MSLKARLSLWLTWGLFLALAFGAWRATGFGDLAAYFPIAVATTGAILAAAEIVLIRKDQARSSADAEERAAEDATLRRDLRGGALNLVWLGLYVAGMVTVGFFTATAAFLFLMLWRGAKMAPAKAGLLSLATCLFLDVFGAYIGLIYPSGFADRAILGFLGL